MPIMKKLNSSLSNVLFPKVRQGVLSLLYGQPNQTFHTNEIIRFANSGTGAVQRELEKLTTAGLITIQSIGNQKHYKANSNSPIFSELNNIVLKTFGLADVLRQALSSIAIQIHIAFIYGSVAKQEDTTRSDIDLMLISENLTYADLFTLLEDTQLQLGRAINPTFYSPSEWSKKLHSNNNFLIQIIKQPKIFLVGNEDELNQFR
ncbi:MAG: transcriptional regulator [Legionellales bacterium RIFCSPHIGHO2_12_FULL_35_11]|nr:MAG: transcriptional regulator [Legionellales bacterium RIFCSPHIGHO2_12_FULL_35_11]